MTWKPDGSGMRHWEWKGQRGVFWGFYKKPIIYIQFFLFWPRPTACGILVPQPGIEPGPMAVKAPSPNDWTARELLNLGISFFLSFIV